MVYRFLDCAWIWNWRHFVFRGACNYAKLILALTMMYFDQISWNLVCRFLGCAWIWNRRHFVFRGACNYAKLISALTFMYFDQMSWNLVCRFSSCALIWNRRHFGFRGARNYAKLIFLCVCFFCELIRENALRSREPVDVLLVRFWRNILNTRVTKNWSSFNLGYTNLFHSWVMQIIIQLFHNIFLIYKKKLIKVTKKLKCFGTLSI